MVVVRRNNSLRLITVWALLFNCTYACAGMSDRLLADAVMQQHHGHMKDDCHEGQVPHCDGLSTLPIYKLDPVEVDYQLAIVSEVPFLDNRFASRWRITDTHTHPAFLEPPRHIRFCSYLK